MIRTQVYLTEEEQDGLRALASQTGKKQSQLVRDAIDRLIEKFSEHRREAVLNEVAGMWKHRKDLSDPTVLRKEWDRNFNR
ncbi:MAG: ribbon-helix-helix domain-containing protein [Kiritimatiellae bacterium]|nr:ribbon-helix-helix domain-containing protein [Kiritimatiellia bacterium]